MFIFYEWKISIILFKIGVIIRVNKKIREKKKEETYA